MANMASEATPTNWGRIAFFFIGYMGLFVLALPALLLWIYQSQVGSLDWPPPTAEVSYGAEWTVENGQFVDGETLLNPTGPIVDARAVIAGSEAAAATVSMDGTLAAAAIGPDAGEALAANYRVTERETLAPGLERVATMDGMAGRLSAEPGRGLIVLGTSEEAAVARFEALPGLTSIATGPPPKVATSGQRWVAFVFLGFWVVLQFFLFGRMASWAAEVPPPKAVQKASKTELKNRLMSLATLDQPLQVTAGERPDELIVDWKWYDAKWMNVFHLSGARRANRIVLRLDPETRTVRAQDRSAALDWSTKPDGASIKWKADRGIRFVEYHAGREYGIILKDGAPKVALSHQWRFNLHEMKQPLIQLVRDAGWSWRPVVTFVRAFGG